MGGLPAGVLSDKTRPPLVTTVCGERFTPPTPPPPPPLTFVALVRLDVGEPAVYVALKLVFLITTLEPGADGILDGEFGSFVVLVRLLRAGGLYCMGGGGGGGGEGGGNPPPL